MICMKPVSLSETQLEKALAGGIVEARYPVNNVPQGVNVIGVKVNIGHQHGKDAYQFMSTDSERSLIAEPFLCPIIDSCNPCEKGEAVEHDYKLWVEEEWRVNGWDPENTSILVEYKKYSDEIEDNFATPFSGLELDTLIKESVQDCIESGAKKSDYGWVWQPGYSPCQWRSAKSMPRWASRLSLEVIDIRIETTCSEQGVTTAEWVFTAKAAVSYKAGEALYD